MRSIRTIKKHIKTKEEDLHKLGLSDDQINESKAILNLKAGLRCAMDKEKERRKKYYALHKEEERERHKKYYALHKEEERERHKRYRAEHKEEIRKKNKNYYALHKEERMEYNERRKKELKRKRQEQALENPNQITKIPRLQDKSGSCAIKEVDALQSTFSQDKLICCIREAISAILLKYPLLALGLSCQNEISLHERQHKNSAIENEMASNQKAIRQENKFDQQKEMSQSTCLSGSSALRQRSNSFMIESILYGIHTKKIA